MPKLISPFWIINVALFVVFIGLVVLRPLLMPLNQLVRNQVERHRNLRIRPLMILTHQYNDVLSFSIQLIVLALVLGLVLRDWRRATVLMAAMFLQTTVVSLAKRLTSIDRPPQLFAHVIMKSGSYPSGHSSASMTFALLVPSVLLPYLSLPLLILLATVLFCIALLTAYGRLYLDVHWLTDILGGWALAGMTFLFSWQFLL